MRDHLGGEVRTVYVRQGEFAVASEPDTVLTAILGSCVGTCLFDAEAGVGGMNHILLPHDANGGSGEFETVNLMELLINALMKQGADRRRLVGKLFGGARMMESSVEIGRMNADFARRFLEEEEIPCIASSLGGACGRKIRFWPVGGRARQFLLREADVPSEAPPPPTPSKENNANDVELF